LRFRVRVHFITSCPFYFKEFLALRPSPKLQDHTSSVVCDCLYKIFSVAGDWRRLNSEELHNFYASLHIIRVIKSRRMRWVGHVVSMG
jgi:hypothetical protein